MPTTTDDFPSDDLKKLKERFEVLPPKDRVAATSKLTSNVITITVMEHIADYLMSLEDHEFDSYKEQVHL